MRPSLNRREAVFGGFCLCCLPTLGRAAEAFAMDEVGPGIFVRHGVIADASADNNDAIANIGFIVGKDSVLVTESGGSLVDGQWLRSEIRKRTDKPIRHVVLTHVHPDHVFGAAAFNEDKPVFIGHAALREALDSRGEYYRQRLADILGADRAGRVVYPTMEVKDGAEVDLGDRKLSFHAHGKAHTTSDLSMLDSQSGLLFSADLLSVNRIPSLDGSLLGWLKEIETLKGFGAANGVPGHGPTRVELAPAFADITRYLSALRDQTRKAIASDVPIEKAVKSVAMDERDRWQLFDNYNTRNVTQAYQELEWE